MNWLNIGIWAFVVLFWSSFFADMRTALYIVTVTVVIVAVMKLDYWLMNKFEREEQQ